MKDIQLVMFCRAPQVALENELWRPSNDHGGHGMSKSFNLHSSRGYAAAMLWMHAE